MSADTIIATERNVLSVLFCDKDTASLVFSIVKSDEVFTHASHRLVFNACKSLYEKDIDLSHQSVAAALTGDDKRDAVFVAVEVAAILAAPSSAKFFCESLLNAHALRKIGVAAKGVLKRKAILKNRAVSLSSASSAASRENFRVTTLPFAAIGWRSGSRRVLDRAFQGTTGR